MAGLRGHEGLCVHGKPESGPPGTLSNQTLWVANENYCVAQGFSWIETGWYKLPAAPQRYKFIYQLPQYGCNYIENNPSGNPAPGTYHFYELYCSPNCSGQVWALYVDGSFKKSVATGWTNGRANRLDAGGEVAGDPDNIGMDGSIILMQYKRGSTWYTAGLWDWESCDYGYWLQYTTLHYDSISDSGYYPPGGCDRRPRP